MFSVLSGTYSANTTTRPQSARIRSKVPPKPMTKASKSVETESHTHTTLTMMDIMTASPISPTQSGVKKLSLIMEHSGLTPITPMEPTPVHTGYSDIEMVDSENECDEKGADLDEIYDDVMKDDTDKKTNSVNVVVNDDISA